ncbi:unnamed protein product, partial [Ectocarpus sp. 4 AP-2014]
MGIQCWCATKVREFDLSFARPVLLAGSSQWQQWDAVERPDSKFQNELLWLSTDRP